MEREEVDIQMSELEGRLERLRALYEHYFMGIERIEPSVPRKDVERRVAELRKTRFHSTAQRFKFQTIVQRYNTMQQHWNRVCREIELGTYRRHKLKAERSFALADAIEQSPPPEATRTEVKRRTADVRKAAEDDLKELLASDLDMNTALHSALRGLEDIPDSIPPAPERGGSLLAKLASKSPAPQAALNPALAASLPPRIDLGRASPVVGPQGKAAPPVARPTAEPAARSTGEPARPAPRPATGPTKPAARSTGEEPARPAPRPAAPAAPPGRPTNADERLSEERVRALHRAYVEARERTQATSVSFEKMERSLRETEAKLRQAHGGKKVDFDVLIKDGKAIIKPRLA